MPYRTAFPDAIVDLCEPPFDIFGVHSIQRNALVDDILKCGTFLGVFFLKFGKRGIHPASLRCAFHKLDLPESFVGKI